MAAQLRLLTIVVKPQEIYLTASSVRTPALTLILTLTLTLALPLGLLLALALLLYLLAGGFMLDL